MKKLLLFGLALGLGFSACSYLDPIPLGPHKDYAYMLPRLAPDGTELCKLAPIAMTGLEVRAWATEVDAHGNIIHTAAVVVPYGTGSKASVFIESTIPNWSLLASLPNEPVVHLTHTVQNGAWFGPMSAVITPTVDYDGTDYEMTLDTYAKVGWKLKTFSMLPPAPFGTDPLFSLPIPSSSSYVNIERLDPFTFGLAYITVKGFGWFGLGPYYTAFKVQYGDAASAFDLIAENIEEYFENDMEFFESAVPGDEGKFFVRLPLDSDLSAIGQLSANVDVAAWLASWDIVSDYEAYTSVDGYVLFLPAEEMVFKATIAYENTLTGEIENKEITFTKVFTVEERMEMISANIADLTDHVEHHLTWEPEDGGTGWYYATLPKEFFGLGETITWTLEAPIDLTQAQYYAAPSHIYTNGSVSLDLKAEIKLGGLTETITITTP